jgi:hypothetical protein
LIKIRFVGEDDIAWFEKTCRRLAEEDLGAILGSYAQKMSSFVDFLRCFHNKNFYKICKYFFLHFAPALVLFVQCVCFYFTGSLKRMIIDGFIKQLNV